MDVVTDGEQRRDNYASFVGGLLDNCQLILLTDLLPLVDDPEQFQKEMQSLFAVHELQFARTLTDKPIKVALPGPYLLTRIMWMECISDRAYRDREHLAADIVRVLREGRGTRSHGASSGRCRSSGRTACSSHRTAALPPSPTTRSSRRRSPMRSYA